MISREAILNAVRRNHPSGVELPPLDQPGVKYDDPVAQFIEVLQAVGGESSRAVDTDDVNRQLAELPAYAEADRICSLVGGVGQSNVDINAVDDPHDLADVDFAILPASFGVAENGAVWLDDRNIKHRVLPFITQHLAILVPDTSICQNMHEAYDRLDFTERRFGVFLSGPSKTADIEQSLVIGAHGARSLIVFLASTGMNV